MAETRFDVVVDSSGAKRGAKEVESSLAQVKTAFIDLSAKIFVFSQTMSKAWEAAKEGARAEETFQRLDRQMGRLGSSANVMVAAMQRVTQSQISAGQAAQMASRALAVGLSPDQIKTFTEAAEGLSDLAGIEIPQAFDALVDASATGSARMIAQMGVFIDLEDEMKKLAFSTGRTTDMITRQERAMLMAKSVAAQTKDTMSELSSGALSDADKLQQVEVKWQEFFKSIKKDAKDLAVFLSDFAGGVADAFRFMLEGGQGKLPHQKGTSGDSAGDLPTKGLRTGDETQLLPFGLRFKPLETQRTIGNANLQASIDRLKAANDVLREMNDIYMQMGISSQEVIVTERIRLQEEELTHQGEILQEKMANEKKLYDSAIKMAGISMDEKINLDNEYKVRSNEIENEILKNVTDKENLKHLKKVQMLALDFAAQQRHGQSIVDNEASNYRIREDMRQRAMTDLETYYKGMDDMGTAMYETDAQRAVREQQLLREQLAFKLRISQQGADTLLRLQKAGDMAGVDNLLGQADGNLSMDAKRGIAESGAAQDILAAERASNNFFAGWSRGMQGYMRDTRTGFGMAQDMARRTASLMEQNFAQFFFDPFKDGWEGMLDSLLNMTKQVMAQIMAQMVTSGILKIFNIALGSMSAPSTSNPYSNFPSVGVGAGSSGYQNLPGAKFGASRGMVGHFGSGTNVTLHGPEAVVPLPDGRSIPVMMQGGSSSVSMPVTIINQAGADVEATPTMGPNGMAGLEILVTRAVNRSLNEGRHDKALSARFGLNPGGR